MNRLHTFDVLAAWYGEYLTIKGYRPRTVADYVFELSFFRRFIEKNTTIHDIDELSAEHIRFYVSSLYERKLTPNTIHHKCSALINFLGAIYEEKKTYSDLRGAITLPRTGKKLPARVLSESDTRHIFEYLQAAAENIVVTELCHALILRDHAMLEVLYGTALRRSEVIALDVCDVNFTDGFIMLKGKGGKERVAPLGKAGRTAVRRYLHEARPALTAVTDALFVTRFGHRVGAWTVADTVRRVSRAAAVSRKVTPHAMRHSCATHMLNHGADIRYVQELLGHESLSSTQIYTHVSIEKLKRTHARYHPRERKERHGHGSESGN